MPSSRERQRKLARAKLDRQLARRAARTRRRRQLRAGIGVAVAVLLITLGGVWIAGGFESEAKPADQTASTCTWLPQDAKTNTNLKDVGGTPPTNGMPQAGTRPMTVTTNQGAPIVASLDLSKSPCAAASFEFLAGKKFYDNTKCHEITAEGALRCGDPSGTGQGGPTYSFVSEYEPKAPAPNPSAPAAPLYPKGTVAVTGATAGSNNSQFLIFLKDFTPTDASTRFSVVGTVTGGTETLDKIAKIPTVGNDAGAQVKPKEDVVVQSLTVGAVAGAATAPSAAPITSGGAPAPSASSQS